MLAYALERGYSPFMAPKEWDWRGELTALAEIVPKKAPGQTLQTHTLTRALGSEFKTHHERAIRVIRAALEEAEGRLDRLSELLACSWHVAGRFVDKAELRGLAGSLRLQHGHPGPTGHGIQRKKRSAA